MNDFRDPLVEEKLGPAMVPRPNRGDQATMIVDLQWRLVISRRP